MLPEGLEFLKPGWWMIHALSVMLVFAFGYRQGRADERRARKARDLERGGR